MNYRDNRIIRADVKNIAKELRTDLKKLEGSNILITGAAGMLTSYIVYTLLFANKNILKKPTKLYLVIRRDKKAFGNDRNITYYNQDISEKIKTEIEFDYIIHAASKAAPKIFTKNMVDTLSANILGLFNVMELCSSKTKSMLFFSSGEVYGSPPKNKAIKEDYVGKTNHLDPRACYFEAKKVAETIGMSYFWEKKIPIKIARIFHTFGPGMNLEDGRMFSDFISQGLKGEDIKLYGDSTIKRVMLYIKDATIMFLKILLKGKSGEVYNVGGKDLVSVGGFAKIIAQEFTKQYGRKIKVVVKQKEINYYKNVVKAIKPDITKFIKTFNYCPTTSTREAVFKTIRSYIK